MANTQAMIGPNGKVYDIPVEMVKKASNDGFRIATSTEPGPRPLPLSTGDAIWNALDNFATNPYANAVKDIGQQATMGMNVGAGKAVGRHVIGAGNLLLQGSNYLTGRDDHIPTPDFLQAKNPGETMGGVVEGTAEFMLPEAWLGKLGKGGVLAKGAKALATGAANAGVQSVQQGEVNRSSGVAGALGFGGSLTGDALTYLGGKYLPKLFNKGLVPSRADMANGANPGMAVMNEGIVGNNYQDIADQANVLKRQVGQQTDTLLQTPQNLAKRVDLNPSLSQVDDLTDLARNQNRQDLANEFANMRQRFTHDVVGDPFDPTRSITVPRAPSTTPLNSVTPYKANLIKRGLNDFTTWGSSPSAMEAGNQMNVSVYGGLNDSILGQVPELESLNSRYQNLRSLAVSAGRRAEFADRAGKRFLGPVIGSQVGMLQGGYLGYQQHGIPGAVAGGIGGALAGSIAGGFTNPAVVTRGMQMVPMVNPFLSTVRGAGLSTYNTFNPSDVHGTNQE